jgi:GrpB-like predicted nucleotidyltransferase (UPF0157 family)
MSAPVIIEDYDPRWPEQFESLRARICRALGLLAVAVEHVGSTAVPGLAAKPIIDLDVLLRDPGDLAEAIARLAGLGYAHRGDLGVPGREAFKAPPDEFPHHLYACMPDSREYRRHLAFRDHLRCHPEDAKEYASLKRKLAAEFGPDREGYSQAKTEFVKKILGQAAPELS